MVQVQYARDQKILDLVTRMQNTYPFVVSADELKKYPVLQDVIERNVEANHRMWLFHSRIYATRFWRYLCGSFFFLAAQ